MWTLLSFTGRFDVNFLKACIAESTKNPPTMPGKRTEQQKQLTRNGRSARARLRKGKMLNRLKDNALRPFSPRQLGVLDQYKSGQLRKEANRCTLISGHGRLKRRDGSFVDLRASSVDGAPPRHVHFAKEAV